MNSGILLFLLIEAPTNILASRKIVSAYMHEVTRITGMTLFAGPLVKRIAANAKDPGGISGMSMWKESGMQVHTWPEKRIAWVSIETCRSEIDEQAVVAVTMDMLKAERVKVTDYSDALGWGELPGSRVIYRA